MLFMPVNVTVAAGDENRTVYSAGPAVFGRKLQALAERAGDMTEPLTAIAGDLQEDVAGTMFAQGSWGGNPAWRELKQPYGDYKQRKVPGIPKLIGLLHRPKGTRHRPNMGPRWMASGKMLAALINPAAMHITPRRVLYAPDSDYAGFHETGTSRMVARPPVQINPQLLAQWDAEWVRWLDRLVTEQGL